MPLLLGQLIHTSFPGVGFQTLASEQVPPEIQQAFVQEIVQQYWDAYNPPSLNYRAIYLRRGAANHYLFGWLYNDGFDDLNRNHVPYFLCYHLAAALTPEQLSIILACLERGPVTLCDRQQVPQTLGQLLVPESCDYSPASPGVAIPAKIRESCQRLLQEGTGLNLFLPLQDLSRGESIAPTLPLDPEATAAIAPDPLPLIPSRTVPVQKLALLIGVSEYGPGFSPLPGVAQDLMRLQQVLEQPTGGFVAVRSLLNPDPQAMAEAIEALFSDCDRDDLVLFYFSGHGIRDSQGQVFLTSGMTRRTPQKKIVRSTLIPVSFINDVMQECPSEQQIVVLDCCFGRASSKNRAGQGNIGVDLRQQLVAQGRVVLTASTSIQAATQKGPEGSTYTFYLVEGLATGAADLDGDGIISVPEWHEYSQRKIQTAIPATTPRLYSLAPEPMLPLAQVCLEDPKLRYRRAVEHFAHTGEISLVNRIVLEALQQRLELTPEVAGAIEQSVLKPHRDYRAKLEEYAQKFVEVVQQEFPLSDRTAKHCKRLQQILGLTDEDVLPLESQVTRQLSLLQPQGIETTPQFSDGLRPASGHRTPDLRPPLPQLLTQAIATRSTTWSTLGQRFSSLRQQWQDLDLSRFPLPRPLSQVDLSRFSLPRSLSRLDLSRFSLPSSVTGVRSLPVWGGVGAGVLALLLLASLWSSWQQGQEKQRLQAIARQLQFRDYETCIAEATRIGRGSRHYAQAQAWLQQCQAGRIWQNSQAQALQDPGGTVWSLAFSPTGPTLAGGGTRGSLRVWDLDRGQRIHNLVGHRDTVWGVAFSPDGQTLLSGSGDGTLKLWDLQRGQLVRSLTGHHSTVWAVGFSPDGQTLLSGSGDGTLALWRARDGQRLRTLGGDLGSVRAIALSPDGQTLVGGGQNGTIKVWQLQTGQLLRTLSGHRDRIISLAIAADGQTLASSSGDQTLKIWNLKDGKVLQTLNKFQRPVSAVAFSPKGQILAASSGNQITLWDGQTGALLTSLAQQKQEVTALSFDPSGNYLAFGMQVQGIQVLRR